jgi:hypothetical protein
MPSRRIYSETLPYEELVRPRTLGLLAHYRLEVVLAVRPWNLGELPDVARAMRDAGVLLSIWPMLADEEGRWANVHNAPAFTHLTLSACDALEAADAPLRDVLFDLEPPFAQARSLAALGTSYRQGGEGLSRIVSGVFRSSAAFTAASAVLAEAVAAIHRRGIATSMAVWPLVALDPPEGDRWQSLLGTPVDALGAGHVSVMMYTSIFEGWSRGALRRRDSAALLAIGAARTRRRWGRGAGVSLGCVGTGAFDDEPTYRDPSELAEDVAIVRAAGCDELALFDLGGVLRREPAEAWLEAFVSDAPLDSPRQSPSRRVRATRRLARAATWALGRLR